MFHRRHLRRVLSAQVGILALLGTACAGTQETTETQSAGGGCSMLDGESVTLVVPYSPGGGYDTYARILAPYLRKELGAEEVVVKNQEGAGGLLAINNLMAAEPDGTQLAIMNGVGVVGGSLADAQGVQFGLRDLSMIGRVAEQTPVFVVGADSRYQTVEDVQAAEGFEFASTGPGAADFVYSSMLIDLLGLDARVVTGFEGSDESELAVIRGDVDGQTGNLDSRLDAIENGDQRPLLLVGEQRAQQLPDTPAIVELDLTAQERALVGSLIDLSAFGRTIVGPPGLSEETLTCLRGAVRRSLQAPGLVEEAKKQERPIAWLSGQRLDELVRRVLDSPARFEQSLQAAYERS